MKINKQISFFKKNCFLLASWRSMTKIAGSGSKSGSISQIHGSADPDQNPHQDVMDPQHWLPWSKFTDWWIKYHNNRHRQSYNIMEAKSTEIIENPRTRKGTWRLTETAVRGCRVPSTAAWHVFWMKPSLEYKKLWVWNKVTTTLTTNWKMKIWMKKYFLNLCDRYLCK